MASSQIPPTEIIRDPGFFFEWKYPSGKSLAADMIEVDSSKSAAATNIAPLLSALSCCSTSPRVALSVVVVPGAISSSAGCLAGSILDRSYSTDTFGALLRGLRFSFRGRVGGLQGRRVSL